MEVLRDFLIRLPRPWKRAVMVVSDSAVVVTAILGAAALQSLPLGAALGPWWQIPLVLMAALLCAAAFGLYSAIIRYIALKVAFQAALATAAALVVLLWSSVYVSAPLFRPDVLVNFGLLFMLGLGSTRVLARHFLSQSSDPDAERLLIYGAGEVGVQVANALKADRRRQVVGFVDDQRDLRHNEVAGLPVYGSARLPALVEHERVSSVLLALPSVSRQGKQEIVDRLEPLPVTVKTVPSLEEILSGRAQVSEIRNIDIEDLLGRDPVPPNKGLLTKSITGHVVMVTGAGGSVGSELCQQIVRLEPRHLVLFDIGECALYHIEREVRALAARGAGDVRVTAVLGDVLDRNLVETCIRSFEVQTLFHAAAYKHVPLVEHNVRAGVQNNVFGTWNAAEAALANGVERFILVSTDKAVRPTNVMGASKRMAELVVQAIAARVRQGGNGRPGCIFSMVRFGNVLGSSGSVVPHFREQIQAGGPVTVTHPEITRFFMTIPEAAELVIQAGAMAKGGEVFVLDMGKPIRILDLARRMIRLAGYTPRDQDNPDGDIEVVFSDLRPGEKLYEELLIGESTLATEHPKIGCAQEYQLPWSTLEPLLQSLREALQDYDGARVKQLLGQAVSGYVAAEVNYDDIGNFPRDMPAAEAPVPQQPTTRVEHS